MTTQPPKLSLEDVIDELLGILGQASTVDICGYLSVMWTLQGPEVVKTSNLSSPQRQTFYLLGLLMTTPEPENDVPLSKGSWNRIKALLEAIADSYMQSAITGMTLDGADPGKAHVATMAFLQRFMSGRLAVAEQLERLVRAIQSPFDAQMRAKIGLAPSEALEIVEWMKAALIDRWADGRDKMATAKQMQHDTVEMLFSGPEPYEEKLKAWQGTEKFKEARAKAQAAFDFTRYANCIEITRFVERFGQERTDAFLRLFALRRGGVEGGANGFRYFASTKATNPAELAPLVLIENHFVCAPMHAMLYNAVYDTYDDTLRADDVAKNRYLKRRADYLESRANELIASLFPNATFVLSKYFETAHAKQEHDGLILNGRSLILIEEKSSEMKTPSRDVERAFRNVRDQFRSNRGIQHAYNQANRVIDLVERAKAPVALYDERGNSIAEIDPTAVEETFAICVTLESFGVLAVDLTLLLDVPQGKQYPWVVNLYDLESLVDTFHRRGLTGDDFLRFLRSRRSGQGFLLSDDELNIAGQFIVEGNLPAPVPETISFVNGYSDLFDDLYFEQHGIESGLMKDAVPGGVHMDLRASLASGKSAWVKPFPQPQPTRRAPKVGRNERCPCGSGNKYKRCCGAS